MKQRNTPWKKELCSNLYFHRFSGLAGAVSLLVSICFFLSIHCTAGDHADPDQVASSKTEQPANHQSGDDASRAPTLLLPTDLPENYHVRFVEEPEFHSQILLVETGLQHKQTVLLVHGLGKNGFRDWLNVIPELSASYHVVALDLPGFGHSAIPSGKYSPGHYARVLAFVVQNYARGSVILIGHSLGGAISLQFARNYPQHLKRLILVDVAGILQRTTYLKEMADSPFNEEEVSPLLARPSAKVRNFISSSVEAASRLPDPIQLLKQSSSAWEAILSDQPNANAAIALIEDDFSDAIFNIKTPTYIIWGAKDRIAPLRTARILAGVMQSVQLTVIEDAEHVPMVTHPGIFNEQLRHALNDPIGTGSLSRASQPLTPAKRNLHCYRKRQKTFTGAYNTIVIDRCTSIVLRDVNAHFIYINKSNVIIENLFVNSDDIALRIDRSVAEITKADIQGRVAMLSHASRLDLAAVRFHGTEKAIQILNTSRLISSISEVRSPLYKGYIHGDFSAGREVLELRLLKGKEK